MGLFRRQFTKEFKLAAVRRLEQGASLAEVARVENRWGVTEERDVPILLCRHPRQTLQEIWKLPPPTPLPPANAQSAQRPVNLSPANSRPAPAPAGAWSRLPSSRTGSR